MSATVGYVDTTLRDLAAHPWAGAISTEEVAAVAARLAGSGAVALEALDAFSARGALEDRAESPWDRLRATVRASDGVPVGIVVAARTMFGARPVPADLARRAVACACESGARRVRVMDPLNDADAMTQVAAAVIDGGAELVPTLVLGPAPTGDDDRWLAEARAIAAIPGASSICVVDRAGHLRPSVLATLIPRLMSVTDLPIELSLVGPGGLAPVAAVEALEAGAARVQAAVGAVALAAARPPVETLRAALAGGARELACDQALITQLASDIWSLLPSDRLRQAQLAEAGPALGIPLDLTAGLISRLARQGHGDKLIEVAQEVIRVASEAGNLTLAHPLGPAVVAQAARHVVDGARWGEVEPVLVAAIRGEYGPVRGPVAPEALAAAEAAPAGERTNGDLDAAGEDAPPGLSEEDLILWSQFPEATQRLAARRLSLVGEATDRLGVTGVDRMLIEQLVDVVESSHQAEVTVEVGGARVTVRKAGAAPAAARAATSVGEEVATGPVTAGGHVVESPIVGTFYAAPSPEAPAFVTVGKRVTEGETICIIEAMKIFNEIPAPVSGTIREILVQNSEAVEYGTPLFVIQP